LFPPIALALEFIATEEQASNGSPAHQKMHDQRNHRQNQQQMNECASDVEYSKTTNPCDQQDDK